MRNFSSYYLNPAALCIAAGMVLAMFFLETSQWIFCLTVILGSSAFAWMFNLRRMLAISEVPVSSVASAAQGYVELIGQTRSLLPLKSPLRGLDCVWFRYWVYSLGKGGIWRLEQYTSSHHQFGMQDGTGSCEIDPEGAEVVTSDRHTVVQHQHKYIEDVLRVGQRVYVLGELNSRHYINTTAQIKSDVADLITGWKRNLKKMLFRFDLNRDGSVDMNEWELARHAAYQEVEARHEAVASNLVPVIKKPTGERLFLISGISPLELRQGYRFWTYLHFLFLLGALIMIGLRAVS